MQVVHISARRWFHRGPGNTYHSVCVTMPDGTQKIRGMTYGYGDTWLYTAVALLNDGKFPQTDRGTPVPAWEWAENNGYKLVTDVVDVPRKRDLHQSA